MMNLSINFDDASFFSCSDYYIAKYLDNNYDKRIIDKLDNERIARIIPLCKSYNDIFTDLEDRISDVINIIDIYFLRRYIIKDKKLFDYLNNDNKKLLVKILNYGKEKVGYYASNTHIFYGDEKAIDVLKKMDSNTHIIYIKDREENFLGTCYVKDLIDKEDTIDNYLKTNYPRIEATLHVSDFIKYNHHYFMVSYPLVEEGKLIGIISKRSLNYILENEMVDDYYKLGGMTDDKLDDDKVIIKKLSWLFVSLFTNFAVLMAVAPFIDTVRKTPMIAIYLVMVMMIVSATSSQSLGSSLCIIRKYGNNTLKKTKLSINEIKKSLIVGLVLSIITFVVVYFFMTITKTNYLDTEYYNSDCITFASVLVLILFSSHMLSSLLAFIMPMIIDNLSYDYSLANMILIGTIARIISVSFMFLFFNIFF